MATPNRAEKSHGDTIDAYFDALRDVFWVSEAAPGRRDRNTYRVFPIPLNEKIVFR
jgi:hypothetical protein